ncbi:hypothetical protein ACIGCK_05490 [Microbacterium sp. NPDC078428]|uniref:hypothetical protein n=1 Tax=Microbacterium sp. NPDC078428 TaxID=3364190 RepID=UPI0037C84B43
MTDARLPGYWLTELRFMDMTDRVWRIFTNSLMWSAEQGTDGHVSSRHYRFLHAEGVTDADIEALVSAELAELTDDGFQLRGWSDERGLRQSPAATVAAYRERKRRNQAVYRGRRKSEQESGDVTGHVAEHVGGGVGLPLGSNSSRGASAYVAGHVTGNASRFCAKHPNGTTDPCWACKAAREAAEQTEAENRPKRHQFGAPALCPSGEHRWTADGTCARCINGRKDGAA